MKRLNALAANFLLIAVLAAPLVSRAQEEPQLTVEQQKEFLLNAKLIKYKETSKGITAPKRCTMSDGRITHDAHFQSINERKPFKELGAGKTEINFVDSYLYNLAAYELAQLVGLADMMPVTVERKLFGQTGALAWWLPVQMDEVQRTQKKIAVPDPNAWNAQMHKLRVFGQLVYDSDRNLGNVLIDKDWQIYMIDFTRAFRLYHDLQNRKDLVKCSRELLDKLRKLDEAELTARTKKYLTRPEIKGVMARRDKIVAHFEKLVAEKGEAQILY